MHFVWGIFHFPSVFYFPTTSGLSQLLKCPDHNIAAIRKHLHILDRLSSLRRVAYNKEDKNRGGYFGFIGIVCFKETIFWSSEAKQWSTLHDDDSIFADSPEQKVHCAQIGSIGWVSNLNQDFSLTQAPPVMTLITPPICWWDEKWFCQGDSNLDVEVCPPSSPSHNSIHC